MRCLLLSILIGLVSILNVHARADEQIALVSGVDGAVAMISREEAEELYSGRTSSLRDGTPVRLLDQPPGQLRDSFYEALIRKNALQTRAHWSRMVFSGRARPPQQLTGTASVSAVVKADPNAIGYLPANEVAEGIRILLLLP